MKHLLLAFVAATALFGFTSCGVNVLRGEGKKVNHTPSLSAFDGLDITISSKVNITVSEGATQNVELSGYENILKHIKTEVKQGVLYISFDLDDTWTVNDDDMEVRITMPSIKMLSLSGAPDVNIHGNVSGKEFKLDVSGASEVVIDNINVENLSADLSGAPQLDIRGGNVKNASYEISGVGKIEAFPMQTEETSASISGAAESEVNVSRKLEANISGAGSIKYKGSPEVIKHISGVGSVEAAK